MRQCRKCGQFKDENEFPWRNRLLERRATICKACTAEQSRDWYSTHQEQQKKTVKARRRDAKQAAQEYVFDYLSHHACVVCGEYRPEMLQFDHIRGTKKKAISQMVQEGASIEAIKEEILKTRVICANCHQISERRKRER